MSHHPNFDLFFTLCSEDETIECGQTSKHKHCTLCKKSCKTPYDCKRHFLQSHESRAVLHNGQTCYPCKLSHDDVKETTDRSHYHCPICELTVTYQGPFKSHLKAHETEKSGTKQQNNPESELGNNLEGTPDPNCQKDAEENSANEVIEEEDEEEKIKVKRNVTGKKSCPICGKSMHAKSVGRHCRDVHDHQVAQMATCVHEKEGLFLVRHSSKGGVMHPIHVKKVVEGEKAGVRCEITDCMDFMRVAWRSGMTTAECRHVQEVGKSPYFPKNMSLSLDALNDLSADGAYRIFSDDKVSESRELQEKAQEANAQCVVPVMDGDRYIHFSVYDGNINYYSRFGRIVVTADLLNGTLDCRCCRRKVTCKHKRICLWYFRETNQLDSFRVASSPEEQTKRTQMEKDIDMDINDEELVYPPSEAEVLTKMCSYILKEKRIELKNSESDGPKPVLLKKLIPTETSCYYCQESLTKPMRITNKARILTKSKVVENVEAYFKKCPKCNVCYRYQEHESGLHNFSDTFIISIDLCLFLRECLQQHLPIGSLVNVLESQLHTTLNSQTVLNAYLHFDSLSMHSYDFNCALCGYHPTTIIMDLNKKVAFDCPVSDLQLPEEYDVNEADLVDVEDFWWRVEMNMVLRGFPGQKVPALDVKPNLLCWAPYIGKESRKSALLYNTEHRKVGRHNGELEKDCREITEERLIELLNNSTFKEVQTFAHSIGCKSKGSKLDQVIQIKNAIAKNDDKFKKAFNKLWGSSGGWVSGTCPHGVIYALKFVLRAESPRDYIDIILSMAHKPNIVVSDMANMLVAHSKNRTPDLFYPHDGMVAEPNEKNIQLAKDGKLDVSLPWLEIEEKNDDSFTSDQNKEVHPVSGSDHYLCLFDRLHEKNVKKEEEILRRVVFVKELKGKLNTQRDEQLHSSYNHDSRYLNNMKPVNHIFLFRSNIDIRNEKINRRLKDGLQSSFKHGLKKDVNGRAMVDKCVKIVQNDGKQEHLKRSFLEEEEEQGKKPDKKQRVDVEETSSIGSVPQSPSSSTDKPRATVANVSSSPSGTTGMSSTGNGQSYLEKHWDLNLGLKNRDRVILEDGLWINDRIVLAAMRLLKEMVPEIGGLQDVLLAQGSGFEYEPGKANHIQILNVRGNHWITISNIHCFQLEMRVYDSLLSLNVKKDKISYPISVEQAACQLVMPRWGLTFQVEDVQQQKRGNDCGLFAITFAALLCMGKNPSCASYHQDSMRKELIRAFETKDMTSYVEAVASFDQTDSVVLYEWNCKVFCHCVMPDDGEDMIMCATCQKWYHCSCEKGVV